MSGLTEVVRLRALPAAQLWLWSPGALDHLTSIPKRAVTHFGAGQPTDIVTTRAIAMTAVFSIAVI